jgi:hypothetical protein
MYLARATSVTCASHPVVTPNIWVWIVTVDCYWQENRRTRKKTCPSATFSILEGKKNSHHIRIECCASHVLEETRFVQRLVHTKLANFINSKINSKENVFIRRFCCDTVEDSVPLFNVWKQRWWMTSFARRYVTRWTISARRLSSRSSREVNISFILTACDSVEWVV